jgi:hypothetical protein
MKKVKTKKEKSYDKYIKNERFLEFLNREFDLTAREAMVEELADFAFSGMEEAIKEFENYGR